jgi:iron complex outermembrane recepter protein
MCFSQLPATLLACWLLALAPAHAQDVQPPTVLSKVEARLPVNAAPPTQDHVLFEFSIDTDGHVFDIVTLESAGEAWDAASREALSQWRFTPAKHEGNVVVSRTRLSFLVPKPSVAGALVDAGEMAESGLADAGTEAVIDNVSAADAGTALSEAESLDAGHALHEFTSTVSARAQARSRGTADFRIEVGELQVVPRKSGGEFLKLAPGILLTNEGGEGHPDRIFLRGFDAKEGQDIELSADGVPINDMGNLHGNGYADLNFLIPELIEAVRVIEGPYDPRQGNFAVAGSAEYELGLVSRGVTVKGTVSSFNTQQVTLLWGPSQQSSKTFAGVSLFRTDGFGQNRGAQNGKALGQYEVTLSETTTLRLSTAFASLQFSTAGILRDDDVRSGRLGFFDTYDNRQGGDSLRGSVSAELHYHLENLTHHHQFFSVLRSSRLKENFTGYLSDLQRAQQTPHGQRGDLIDRDTESITFGARGYGRLRRSWNGRAQEIEAGYFARIDSTQAQQQRLLGPDSNVPYQKEYDLGSRISDIGMYLDLNVAPLSWLTIRGGVRAELLSFNVQNRCAVQEVRRPSTSRPPGDDSCLSQRDFGLYREPTERVSANGSALLPRASVLVGPFKHVTVSAAYGEGIRSVDPQFVNEARATPFASIRSYEAGVTYANRLARDTLDFTARAAAFSTRVDKDQIFDEQAGRNLIGGSTTRAGGLVQTRMRGSFYDVSSHLTVVQSRFDDTGFLVPYVPDVVFRFDGAVFSQLPLTVFGTALSGSVGFGTTFVGRRALPFGQRSDTIFVSDVNAELTWRWAKVGVMASNLFDARYRLAEFNYASDFRTQGAFPPLVPTRHFSAGTPRQLGLTLSLHFGGAQ